MRVRRMSLLAALGGILLLGACGRATQEHLVLEPSIDALRSDFVADSGRVRAIFLASPT